MAITYAKGKSTSSARTKVVLAALFGVLVALMSAKLINWKLAPLLGWDAAAAVYVTMEWLVVTRMNGTDTQAHAVREDPSRGITTTLVLFASVASLITVAIVLSAASKAEGAAQTFEVLLGVVSVVIAWIVVHTLFMLRYGEMYYRGTPGGVEFDGTRQPSYHDFAYLSFTIGMTFQVSDTGFQNSDFRRMALKHALISFMFSTVIVATTINLIAGLTK
jgi:uncharacterized membrane protein